MCPYCFDDLLVARPCSTCGYADEISGRYNNLPPGLPLGMRINGGRYTIGRVLGIGGFGITYLGYDEQIRRKVAIKEFFPQDVHELHRTESNQISSTRSVEAMFRSGLDDFLEEANTLCKFESHPNIVTVYDLFKDNNTAYMVMQYLDGMTLQDYLDKRIELRQNPREPVVEQGTSVDIILVILDALRDVHSRDYYHRDIKPQNIILANDSRPVLIDFGSAKLAVGSRSQQLQRVISHGFSPIEQYQSSGQGPWTDIYSVCATLYYMVTGEIPVSAVDRVTPERDPLRRPDEFIDGLSTNFCDTIMQGLAIKAVDRYQSAGELQQSLGSVPPVTTSQWTPEPPVPKKRPKWPKYIPWALTTTVLGVIFFVWFTMLRNPVCNNARSLFEEYRVAAGAQNEESIASAIRELVALDVRHPNTTCAVYYKGLAQYSEAERKRGMTQAAEMYASCQSDFDRVILLDLEWEYPGARILSPYCAIALQVEDMNEKHREEVIEFQERYPSGMGSPVIDEIASRLIARIN